MRADMEWAIASGTSNTTLRRRLHSVSGLFPLGAYLCFHAWEHWPVRASRDELFARLEHSSNAALEGALVLLPLLLHAVLGFKLAREPDDGAYAGRAYRRLQAVTGALSGAFLLYHLAVSWLPRLIESTGAAYGSTVERSGTLGGLILHAVGIAAVCTHFGQGLGAALPRLFPDQLGPHAARWLGGTLALALWLAFINELAGYATYAPLL
jgi:succinate dehydrogenase/fumarate reductase cytochrome b subunit